MAKRESAASQSRRGTSPMKGRKASPAQREALKRGQEAQRKLREEADPNRDGAKERWAKLLDGTLTVRDLDDEEVKRMQVRNKHGMFGGKRPAIPSHLAQQFQAEMLRRANDLFRENARAAVEALCSIATDPDVKEGDRVRAASIIIDRALGKVPETVHLKTDDPWTGLLGDALGEDRTMAEFADTDGEQVDRS